MPNNVKEIKDLPSSQDVDKDWPKEGRDYTEINGKWYWKHEKVPMGEIRKEGLLRMQKREEAKREGKAAGGGKKASILNKDYTSGDDFPDLTGDGKVTRADVLKGRGVFAEGGDVDSFRMMYEAFKKEMAAAKDAEEKAMIQERFQEQTQNVDEETKREVYKSMDRKREADGGSILSYDDYDFKLFPRKGKASLEEIAKMAGGDPKDLKSVEEAKKFLKGIEKGELALLNKYTDKIKTKGERKQNEKKIAEFKKLVGGYQFSSFLNKAKKLQERAKKQEGGSMLVPPEMPVDTYTPEEQANAEKEQLPDSEMENNYMDFVLDESLQADEQEYLMNALEADPKLNSIIDKVIMTASEFSGAGEVEGPGTGVSDSIPARLSDGEFVITEKATDQIGADNLQRMMDDAERMADGGEARYGYQMGGMLSNPLPEDEEELLRDPMQQTEDEINKSMMQANRMPSLMGAYR